MRETKNREKQSVAGAVVSLLAHAGLLVFLLALGTLHQVKTAATAQPELVAAIEVAGGAHAVEIPLPTMRTAAQSRDPVRDEESQPQTMRPVVQTPVPRRTGGGAPAVARADDGMGNAARGNGSDDQDATPAFPVFSPKPAVSDRGLLPVTEQKIVVDVEVDEQGAVVSETLVKGMGNALDQIVLATVKTWRFQPAKVRGKTVATEAELIFPFDLNYPVE